MNKLTTIIASTAIAMLSFASTANSLEYKVGLTGQATAVYGNVEETMKDSGKKTSEEALGAFSYASGFAEISIESALGLTIGLEYSPDLMEFPTADRVISTAALDVGGANVAVTGESSGTQTIKASVEEALTMYVAMPIMGSGLHVKVGLTQATLKTEESLATGSTYKDVDLDGTSVGMYYDGDIGDMAFYRVEGSYTEYDDLKLTGSEEGVASSGSFNTITGELGGVAAKLSLGLRF
ncbi:hypothetical protein [Candidatus Pelagibacter sp. Uisw_113]|uniref:hypothetical protein n=1 Tax=Candidatus Pelagibacter sp. Uisw_113 TaxID=3230994 RepID=UPI0039ED7423